MVADNLLRLSFMLSSEQATTLNNSIVKIAKLAIFNCDSNQLNIPDINSFIKKEFELEFTEQEIEDALSSRINGIVKNPNGSYSLTSHEIQKIEKCNQNAHFQNCIDRFIKSQQYKTDKEQIIALINQYIYEVINSNKLMILSLINNDKDKLNSYLTNTSFDNAQREIINKFLNWNDPEKNKYIFEIISSSIEYCMLTVKKDVRSFQNVFQGKKFLIDTNVILRLIGANNEERKEVINSFIKKCTEVGIKLCYSNFTQSEIETNIGSFIDKLPYLTNSSFPINPKSLEKILSKNTPGFYNIYYEWCLNSKNLYSDLSSFKHYLISLYRDAVRKYKFIIFPTYKQTRFKDKFDNFFNSLKEYKSPSFNSFFDEAITVDVNNFMYVLQKREYEKQGNHFWDVNDYLISTDNKLCKWSKDLFPGVVPYVLLPSVWHSLILKFKGRTESDYRAFCLFLNLRYKNEEEEENKSKKLLLYINQLPEEADIKERVIDNINENINGLFNRIQSPEKIVEFAYQNIKDEDFKKKEIELLLKNESILKEKENQFEDKYIRLLAEDKADKKIIKNKKRIKLLIICSVALLSITFLGIGIYLFVCVLNNINIDETNKIVTLTTSEIPIGGVIIGLISLLYKMNSFLMRIENRKENYITKEYLNLKKELANLKSK